MALQKKRKIFQVLLYVDKILTHYLKQDLGRVHRRILTNIVQSQLKSSFEVNGHKIFLNKAFFPFAVGWAGEDFEREVYEKEIKP